MQTVQTEAGVGTSGVPSDSEQPKHHNAALDGIRGIAVLSVMLFHFGLSWLPGGYLGVDIFFVLSGYLITTLLLREHTSTGRISFGSFWAKRARRLFPALGLMLLAVAVATSVATPLMMKTVFGEGIATLLYSNNWLLILQQTDYFDQFQAPSPLLHTWSLGVEEQWYVVFPLVLILALYVLRRHPGRLTVLLFGLAGTSAAWGAYLTITGAPIDRIYFGTDVRAQELLIGAGLATLLHFHRNHQTDMAAKYARPVGWAGVITVALLLLTTHGSDRWQYSVGLLILSLGVAAVIWASTRLNSPFARTLAWRPLAFVGLISYGLYLWHWPLLVWIRPDGRALSTAHILSVLILTFAVAIASFYLLEMPVRTQRWTWTFGKRGWQAAIIAPLLIAATLSACTQDRRDVVGEMQQGQVYSAGGYGGTGPKVFLLGDSVGANLRGTYGRVSAPGFALTGTTFLGCGVLPNRLWANGVQQPNDFPCEAWSQQWPRDIIALRPELTVVLLPIQLRHDIEDTDGHIIPWGTPEYQAFVERELEKIRITAMKGSRGVAMVDGTCNRVPGGNPVADQLNDDSRQKWINGVLVDYLRSHKSVYPIKLADWDCGPTAATATANAAARKYDGLHYNPSGSLAAWGQIAPQIRSILAKMATAPDPGVSANPVPQPN